jgi:hypothetical protein
MSNPQARGHFRDLTPLSAPGAEERPWIHIVPAAGEYPGTVEIPAGYDVPGHGTIEMDLEVEGLTVITEENLAKMIERFEPEMLVDYEHHSHDPDKRTDAAGWGHALRVAADGKGLEQQTEWAKPARQEITDKVYRYISPEFAGSVRFEDGTYKFFPTRLTGAGLTNRPKLKSLRPVSANRETNKNTEMKAALTLLCGLIGASESATEQELTQKVEAFRADVATSRNRAKDADTLEAENKRLKADQIDADLERFADVIDDKESAKDLLQLNRDKAVKVFEGLQAKLGKKPAGKGGEGPLFQKNRATAPDGEKKFREAAEEDEKATAKFRAIEARAQVIAADRKIPFAQAFEAAKAEAGA